jgi:GAF domain-containing protein
MLHSATETSRTVGLKTQHMCARLENAEVSRAVFLEQCTRLVAATVGCSRAGVWVFRHTADGQELNCLAMYDGVGDRMTTVQDEAGEHVHTYFQTLEQVGYVIAADAQTHFATAGFFSDRLEPRGVRSMMAASFSVNGRLFGAFTCTQVGSPMEWSRPQLNVLRQIGSRASLALATYDARTALDTRPAALPV